MENKIIRIFMSLAGVTVGGISVGMFKCSMFGTDPFQVFVYGLSSNITVIGFGTFYAILNVLMLITVFLIKKHYIGIATLLNVFFYGYIAEFSEYIIHYLLGETLSFLQRVFLMIFGIVIMCFATSIYFTADLGVSTYDAIALIMRDKKLGEYKFLRMGTDLFCVVIGYILGGVVGVGTIITALFMGPLIGFFKEHVADVIIKKTQKKEAT